jgi:hypothetical protein
VSVPSRRTVYSMCETTILGTLEGQLDRRAGLRKRVVGHVPVQHASIGHAVRVGAKAEQRWASVQEQIVLRVFSVDRL